MAFKNIISVSGGKDSTAMLCLAVKRGLDFKAVFADTGNENEIVYEYLDYLEQALDITIFKYRADFTAELARKREKTIPEKWVPEWIEAGMSEKEAKERAQLAIDACQPTGNPFLDLCLWKSRFPASKSQFCTTELKTNVMETQVLLPEFSKGHRVISWQGVRAEESRRRSKLPPTEKGEFNSLIYRPLLHWTWQDVFKIHKKMGIEPNPLYKRGMGRVGCMPCVNANKSELAAIAREFPSEIDRVEDWEKRVAAASKRGKATLFQVGEVPGWPKELELIDITQHGIRGRVEYAKTSRGGRQSDWVTETADAGVCRSAYGLCG